MNKIIHKSHSPNTWLAALVLCLSTQTVCAADYYVSPNGHDGQAGGANSPWRSAQKAARTAIAGDTVYFQQGIYTGSLTPEHSGHAGAYITFKAAPGAERKAIIDHGQVAILGKSYIKIIGLKVQNAPSVGIFMQGFGSHIEITNNHVYKTGSSGISAWGAYPWRYSDPTRHQYKGLSHIVVENNTVEQACLTGWNEIITFANGIDQFEIKGNLLIDGGHPPVGGEGIDIKEGVSNGKIYNNEITNLARIAIYVDGGRGGNYADPLIHNIEIFNNYVHDSGSEGISIVTEGPGGVDNIKVYNNVVANMTGNGILVYDHPHGSGPISNIEIVNNTSYGNARTGLLVNHSRARNILMRNNIAYANGTNLRIQAVGAGLIEDFNLVNQNPQFVNPSVHDFHLQASSPALNAGIADRAPATDFDGHSRPIGGAIDMGAFESGSTLAPRNPNQAPTAIPQSVSTSQNTPIAITLTANDPENDLVGYQVSSAQNGSVSGTAPALLYTPNADFIGTDRFSFTVNDGDLNSGPAVITITITGSQDHQPQARDDHGSTDFEQTVTLAVLANDRFEDGVSSVVLTNLPSGGIARVNQDHSITYTPDAGFVGNDHFSYELTDSDGDSDTATVTLTVIAEPGDQEPGDLFAHWSLDQGSGNTILDRSGQGHDGQLVGPTWIGNELNFDGRNDYIDLGTLDITGNAVTISARFRSDDLANCGYRDCRILSKANGVSEQAHVWMLSTVQVGNETRLRFRLKTNGVTHTLIADRGQLQSGTWVDATAVYDGGQMILYQNGVEVGRRSKHGAISSNANIPAWIGGNPNQANSRPWAGQIQAVRIYQRALTAENIRNLVQ